MHSMQGSLFDGYSGKSADIIYGWEVVVQIQPCSDVTQLMNGRGDKPV